MVKEEVKNYVIVDELSGEKSETTDYKEAIKMGYNVQGIIYCNGEFLRDCSEF